MALACEDLNEGRTQLLTGSDLAPAAHALSGHEFVVTDTFWSLWQNLSHTATPSATTLLSVMHGIAVEPRHPAFRVEKTDDEGINRATVGDTVLVFTTTGDTVVWLAVIPER